MQTIHAYIHFPENLPDQINTIEDGLNIFRDFQMAIDLVDCEKSSKLYYSKTNKDIFFEEIRAFEELSELNIGSYDFETAINNLFNENEISQVNESPIVGCQIKSYDSIVGILKEEVPLVFYDLVRKNEHLNENDKQLILNLFNAFFSQNPMFIIKDCDSVTAMSIPFVTNFIELFEWLNGNRLVRNYNVSDNRHIENHPQSQITSKGKSPLIGGLGGKENASLFLRTAIGDKRQTKDIINFDTVNMRYIWYEYENDNPQNQYHGYHLVKTNTYENDTIAIANIPERVIIIINYLEEILINGANP